MKKKIFLTALVFMLVVGVIAAWAWAPIKRPSGVATPYIYDLSLTGGPSGTIGSYYLDIPTLSANDTFCGLTTTQTLTNKTLTSPTITGATLTTVDINSGAIDGTPIGAASANTGAFTTLGATGAVTFGSTLDVTGKTTLGDCDITSGDATAYTIATFLSTGTSTLGDGAGDTVIVKGVTLTTAGTALLDDASADAQLTTLGVSTFVKTILDDAAATNVRDTIGLGTIATQAADSVNLDGGAIDGTTIGASTAAAGTFTTLATSGAAHFTGTCRSDGGFVTGSDTGATGYFDDGSNFRVTVTKGIITEIAASSGAGYTQTAP